MSCRRSRFRLIAACCITLSALAARPSAADPVESPDKFPSRPITITVTFPPGGGTDILARLIGNYLGDTMGHPAVVENKPGASGNVGAKLSYNRGFDDQTATWIDLFSLGLAVKW